MKNMNQETKTCQNCKKEFTIEPEDFSFYNKIQVPPPTFCPECRYQRRLANRNEWNFYHRICDLCKRKMVSIYNPLYAGPVYCQPCYWSDKWDSLEYGRDFDFNRPFFEQFHEHRFRVPRIALANSDSVNSEYTNQAQGNKNCYMCVSSSYNEDCLYGSWNQNSRECMDCYAIKQCELLYDCSNCHHCARSAYLENCTDVINGYFLKNCRGCNDCFGCIGLSNKSHYWFNEQLSKEEYNKRLKAFIWTNENIAKTGDQFLKHKLSFPHKYYQGQNNVGSTGDYILNCKNTRFGFNVRMNEEVVYAQDAWEARDCRDLTETLDNELEYELEGVGWSRGSIASCKAWYSSDIFYSELSFYSTNLIGCVSSHRKNYCIFNKQYSKEDYQQLKSKIIEHMKKTKEWGEFFPVEISPFPYNDTMAQNYFPLTKREALARGWRWHDGQDRDYKITKSHNEIIATINEVSEDITQQVIGCKTQSDDKVDSIYSPCATAFRITPAELRFYRKMNLPIPNRCFPCRLHDRLNRRNPRRLLHRKCQCAGEKSDNKVYVNTAEHSHHKSDHCPNEFETTYSPERKEIVYCEKCYQEEVV